MNAGVGLQEQSLESNRKRPRLRPNTSVHMYEEKIMEHVICEMKTNMATRLANIELKMEVLTNCCNTMLNKIESIERHVKQISAQNASNMNKADGPTTVLVPQSPPKVSAAVGLDSTMQVITLNSEQDYPDGSWLGEENNVERRVRCPVPPIDLIHINTFCHCPEKMALTLLDYLFPREVQAVSNLSGKGKHCKKQLDPLMIYGIRCHLQHRFKIAEKDWHRIKQNMDSKCRTAWRRKLKGLPLGGHKGVHQDGSVHHDPNIQQDHSLSGEEFVVSSTPLVEINGGVQELETQVIQTSQGEIRVLHATPEQFAQIQEGQHIEILTEEQLLQNHAQILAAEPHSIGSGAEVSLGSSEQTLAIVTSSELSEEVPVEQTFTVVTNGDSQEMKDERTLTVVSSNEVRDLTDELTIVTSEAQDLNSTESLVAIHEETSLEEETKFIKEGTQILAEVTASD